MPFSPSRPPNPLPRIPTSRHVRSSSIPKAFLRILPRHLGPICYMLTFHSRALQCLLLLNPSDDGAAISSLSIRRKEASMPPTVDRRSVSAHERHAVGMARLLNDVASLPVNVFHMQRTCTRVWSVGTEIVASLCQVRACPGSCFPSLMIRGQEGRRARREATPPRSPQMKRRTRGATGAERAFEALCLFLPSG
jgi:hypothetical protein